MALRVHNLRRARGTEASKRIQARIMLEAKRSIRESTARPNKELPLEYNEGPSECTLVLNVWNHPHPRVNGRISFGGMNFSSKSIAAMHI